MTHGTRVPIAAHVLCWILVVLGGVTVATSGRWIGASFPGFFLMPNRVVPSAGLPGWAGGRDGRPVYHHVLLAADGVHVDSSAAGYRLAGTHRPGDLIDYVFVRHGEIATRTLEVVRFGWGSYVAVFGAYGLTGIAYLLLAFAAISHWTRGDEFPALAAFAWAGAAYSFTGIDLYGAATTFRLHAAAEVFLAAGATHVALVCPRPASPSPRGAPVVVYGVAAVLALVYQIFLYEPRAYSVIHNLAQGLIGIPILVLVVRFSMVCASAVTEQLRRAARLQLGGILVGLVAPAIVFGISSVAGGDIPISTAAWLNFAFPVTFVAGLRVAPPETSIQIAPARASDAS